ncbi:MAG: GNAT family N-acetyltransferase [Proteobacteria bacterium]|nr:GNAT family N-acetyltransferase [Pseudomonadota bacterium]
MTGLVVRPLTERDLADADRINRIAFGTFFGLENPMNFRGDGEVVTGRFRNNPDGAFAADIDGRLVACGFVMDWGSVGIFGPLTVDVDHWGRGIARSMMDAMTGYMDDRGFDLQGLFTHPQSAKHIRLYEAYDFRMQRITAVMAKEIDLSGTDAGPIALFSGLADPEKTATLAACTGICQSVFPGLDLTTEILSIEAHGFGDTVLVLERGEIVGFACCHHGAGSESGSAQVLVKFAAVRSGQDASRFFELLLDTCERFTAALKVNRVVAGTNTGRTQAYETMLAAGYRTWMNGIAMHKTGNACYDLPGRFVIDDWR